MKEHIDARNMGKHPLCDVWLDGQIQGNAVVEMMADTKPNVEIKGWIKIYKRDATNGQVIIKNDEMVLVKKSGHIKWRPI